MLQTIAPALSFARATSTVPLTGGTHVPCSPCFRYLPLHRLHYMRRIGFNLQLGLKVAGFYSRGGGPIRAVIQWNQALKRLREVPKATEIEILCLSSSSQGTFLLLLCQYGFQSLGARGKPTKRVSDEAVAELLDFLTTDGAVDQFLSDQLVLPLALARGVSEFRTSKVTLHFTTAETVGIFLPIHMEIEGTIGQAGSVRIRRNAP